MEYILFTLISKAYSKLLIQPLRSLSYVDEPIFTDDHENMLCILLSSIFILAFSFNANMYMKTLSVILFFCLVCISYTDTQSGYIFDRFNVVILLVGIILIASDFSFILLKDKLIGAMAGGGFLSFMNSLSIIVFKKEGIGGGDIKLCFACGLVLGIDLMIVAFILSFIPAAIYTMFVCRKSSNDIALGPFLCVSIICSYCLGMS